MTTEGRNTRTELARRFEYGERVFVRMATNDVFPWQSGPTFEAEYIHGPGGPGDTLAVLVDGYGRVAINQNSAEFTGIWAVDPERPTDGPF